MGVDSASTRCLRGTRPRIIESRRGAKGAIGFEEPILWTTSSPCTQYLSVGGFRNLGDFGDFAPDSQRGSGIQRLHPHALGSGLTLGLSVPAWRGDISRATMGIVVVRCADVEESWVSPHVCMLRGKCSTMEA